MAQGIASRRDTILHLLDNMVSALYSDIEGQLNPDSTLSADADLAVCIERFMRPLDSGSETEIGMYDQERAEIMCNWLRANMEKLCKRQPIQLQETLKMMATATISPYTHVSDEDVAGGSGSERTQSVLAEAYANLLNIARHPDSGNKPGGETYILGYYGHYLKHVWAAVCAIDRVKGNGLRDGLKHVLWKQSSAYPAATQMMWPHGKGYTDAAESRIFRGIRNLLERHL